ncbi:MAG TPA: hypothetical protein PLV25_05755 [Opitutales bacterium]|nr:hypothetical protein [Opitutales bacterium]
MQAIKRPSIAQKQWIGLLSWGCAAAICMGIALYSYRYLHSTDQAWHSLCARSYALAQQPIAPTSAHAKQATEWIQGQADHDANIEIVHAGSWEGCLESIEEQAHANGVRIAHKITDRAPARSSRNQAQQLSHGPALEALTQASLALKPYALLELECLAPNRWKIAYQAGGDFAEHWAQAIAQLPEVWILERLHIYRRKNTTRADSPQPEPGIVLEAVLQYNELAISGKARG